MKTMMEAYSVIGVISIGNEGCKGHDHYTNVMYFLDWIKETVDKVEQDMCNTKFWTSRTNKRMIFRMDSDGCQQGTVNDLNISEFTILFLMIHPKNNFSISSLQSKF